jgi:NAD(P)-dependent dehydrogenase (short-subunit alcohol dehydrogenase family)
MTLPRAVLITGASSGIGRACALELDRRGYRVYAGVRRAEDAAALREQASERMDPVFLDVTEADTIRAVAARIGAEAGAHGLYGLVNNAGIGIGGPLELLPIADLRRQLEVNVIGLAAVTQACIPLLRAARGRIVNISSRSGTCAFPGVYAYAAAKFAVEALSDSLRVELRPWGVRVVVVQPGDISTSIWSRSVARGEASLTELSDEGARLYGPLINFLFDYAAAPKPLPASAVATVVARALSARLPRTRYIVGGDARLFRVLARLPDRLRDALLTLALPRPWGFRGAAHRRNQPGR